MDRRFFLKSSIQGVGLTALIGGQKAVAAKSKKKTLVVIFQRGGMDGLSAVQPLKTDLLRKIRPSLTLKEGKADNQLRAIHKDWGLHPSLEGLLPLYEKKKLAVIHGVGLPNPERSHFDAQDYMETATPFKKGTRTGWLNRVMDLSKSDSPLRALALSKQMPKSFYGPHEVLVTERLDQVSNSLQRGGDVFTAMYQNSESFAAAKYLREIEGKLKSDVVYPRSPLSRSLQQVARLIHSDAGMEYALVTSGGWDMHAAQPANFTRNARELGDAMAAFYEDVGKRKDVLVLTMTEFGRTVLENGARGTDHGRGSCFFAMGHGVKGGKVYGKTPGLRLKDLEDERDLPVTIDFRAVLAEVVREHLGFRRFESILPGFKGKPLSFLR